MYSTSIRADWSWLTPQGLRRLDSRRWQGIFLIEYSQVIQCMWNVSSFVGFLLVTVILV